jgi:hypothetical protein
MRNRSKTEPSRTISKRYSVGREGLYLTRESAPWHVNAQCAYIAVRRVLFGLQHQRVPIPKTDVIVSHRHAAVIVTIPKSGSRSLLAAFLDRWSKAEGIWSETTTLETALRRNHFGADYSVVAVVRNPWDRVFSCYRDKIARLDRRRARAHRIARYRGLRPFMPFDAFVEWLDSDEGADPCADRHWLSQSVFLRVRNEYCCDHVFRIEDLPHQIQRLRSVLSAPDLDMPYINFSGASHYRRQVYNERTRAIVQRRYEEDIERFRYIF